jgi:hypothetical protein
MSEVILYPIKQSYPEGLETPLNMVHRYFMRLYEESLSEPEYVLLCLQDYLELLDEVSHLFWRCDRPLSVKAIEEHGESVVAAARQDPWIKLANTATGKFALVSTLPNLPRCQEFSQAHLAFAHWRHRVLPALKSGEIIALCPSSAEKYLDRKYGRKP